MRLKGKEYFIFKDKPVFSIPKTNQSDEINISYDLPVIKINKHFCFGADADSQHGMCN